MYYCDSESDEDFQKEAEFEKEQDTCSEDEEKDVYDPGFRVMHFPEVDFLTAMRHHRGRRVSPQTVEQSLGNPLSIDVIEPRDIWRSSFNVEGLPRPPFRMVFNAQTNSGKTNVLMNLLQKNRYGGYFKKIIIISETLQSDPKWAMYASQPQSQHVEFYDKYTEATIDKIFDDQKQLVDDGKQSDSNALLLIVDDAIAKMYNRGRPKSLENCYMKGRHFNISMIITSQFYTLIPVIIRVNAEQIILFEMPNRREIKKCGEEHGNGLTMKEWKQLTSQVWSDPYSFLMLDYTQPRAIRMRKNLDKVCLLPPI